jgi:hypothetical protein
MRARCLVLLLLLLLPVAAVAQPARVGVRVGDHAGHGRVVFDWPAETAYRVEEEPGRVTLRFAAPALFDLSAARRPPRNARGIEAAGDSATILVAPGVLARVFRLGPRVVVDLLNADGTAPVAAAARPPPATAPRAAPTRPPTAPPAAPAPAATAAPLAAAPASAAASVAAAGPAPANPGASPAPRTQPLQPVAGGTLVPAAADVGAALVRRGAVWLLVLDAPLPLDLAPLRGGPLAGAEASSGPHATVLRLPVASLPEPRLTRRADGWLVEAGTAPPALRSIVRNSTPGRRRGCCCAPRVRPRRSPCSTPRRAARCWSALCATAGRRRRSAAAPRPSTSCRRASVPRSCRAPTRSRCARCPPASRPVPAPGQRWRSAPTRAATPSRRG